MSTPTLDHGRNGYSRGRPRLVVDEAFSGPPVDARSWVTAGKRRVVVLGGGTGSHTLLSGLRGFDLDLTSVVSVMDSGGSSGRLREEYGVLPPGDARQCLVALASDDEWAEMLRLLFAYRFHTPRLEHAAASHGLDGHNLGNLLITALSDITGSVEQAYAWAGRLLGARGRVIPVSTSNVHLCARLTDGQALQHEADIDLRTEQSGVAIEYVYLSHAAYPTRAALDALRSADLVVLGPGDLYTSIIPNLLVEGIVEALAEARHRALVVNLMTKPGETDGYRASTFVERILEYVAPAHLDAAFVNDSPLPAHVLRRYAAEGAVPVNVDLAAIEALGVEAVTRPMASRGMVAHHDPVALGQTIHQWLDAHASDHAQAKTAGQRPGAAGGYPASPPTPNGQVVARAAPHPHRDPPITWKGART
jgi:uncharacterized cofD-like protein